MKNRKPIVTIVGVPNTGKSTLFNRLTGTRKALVHSDPGMTRDVINGVLQIENQEYQLQDTGGVFDENDIINLAIKEKVVKVSKRSDLVLFLFDGRRELLGFEEDLYFSLKKTGINIICVVNKVENPERYVLPNSYYKLCNEFLWISAEHGHNIDLLLDAVSEKTPKLSITDDHFESQIKIGVVGKPNVGKSSLVNAIFNEDVAIVSEIPGTTRDSVDLEFKWHGNKFIIVDNAGIRKMQKVKESTESAAVLRAIRVIGEVDIIVFVVDITKKLDQTDLFIAKKIEESHKPVVIVANKWDLVHNKDDHQFYRERLYRQLYKFSFAPVVFTSALENHQVQKILFQSHLIFKKLHENYKAQEITRIVKDIVAREQYKTMKGDPFSVKYAAVETTRPFFFVLSCSRPDHLRSSIENHFKKKLTETIGLIGIPVFIKIIRTSSKTQVKKR